LQQALKSNTGGSLIKWLVVKRRFIKKRCHSSKIHSSE